MITLLGLSSLRTCKPACVQAPFLTLHTTHGPVATFLLLPGPRSEKPHFPA